MSSGVIGERAVLVNGSEVLATTNPLHTSSATAARIRDSDAVFQTLGSRAEEVPDDLARTDRVHRSDVLAAASPVRSNGHSLPRQLTLVEEPTPAPLEPLDLSKLEFIGPSVFGDLRPPDSGEVARRFEDSFVGNPALLFAASPASPYRRTRVGLIAMATIVVGGLVGGATFARFGPDGNLLAALVAGWAELNAPTDDRSAGGESRAEMARRAFELDTLVSLRAAEREFKAAAEENPGDAELRADRALALTTLAALLVRLSMSDEAAALVETAGKLARDAHAEAPESVAVHRALADHSRLVDSELAMRHLERARALAAAQGSTDPATIHIEATLLAGEITNTPPAELERATRLLEEALTQRPSLVRSRVLLARILETRGQRDLARLELERALSESPGHEEATRRLEHLAAQAESPPTPAVEPSAPAATKNTEITPTDRDSTAKIPPPAVEPLPAVEPSPEPTAPEVSNATAHATSEPPKPMTGYASWMKQGEKLREAGDAWKALHAFERAADLRPSSSEAYVGMGYCYLDLNKAVAAFFQFKKATTVDASSAAAHLGLARSLEAQGKADEAIAEYETVASMLPDGPDARASKAALERLESGR